MKIQFELHGLTQYKLRETSMLANCKLFRPKAFQLPQLQTFNNGLIFANKAARQLLCSSLLFCFQELNRFLEISVRDPWKILRVSRNSKLDPQNLVLEPQKSKLDSQKLQGSRIKFRVETVNLHLSGTVPRSTLVTSVQSWNSPVKLLMVAS